MVFFKNAIITAMEKLNLALSHLNKQDDLERLIATFPGPISDFSEQLDELGVEMLYCGEEMIDDTNPQVREAGRRLVANASDISLQDQEVQTGADYYRVFGITDADREFFADRLLNGKAQAQAARKDLISFYKNYRREPFSSAHPGLIQKARTTLMKRVRHYAGEIGPVLFPDTDETIWKNAPFYPSNPRSMFNYAEESIGISISETVRQQGREVDVHAPSLAVHIGHEGAHWRNHVQTKSAPLHPLFQRSDLTIRATQESIASFFESQAVELLASERDQQEALAWWINVQYAMWFSRISLLTFTADTEALADPQQRANVLEYLSQFALVRGAENETYEEFSSNLIDGTPPVHILDDLKYTSSIVQRGIDKLQARGIFYKENRKTINNLLLTGYYTPKGLDAKIQQL